MPTSGRPAARRRAAAAPPDRVLVLYRKSTYETLALDRRDARFLDLLERRDPTVRKMETVHLQHRRCLEQVLSALDRAGVRATAMERSALRRTDAFDLIVTIGGDGTFLNASHRVLDVPVLGVVSSDASTGHFCATDGERFAAVFRDVASGRLRPLTLQRLQVVVGTDPVPEPALNEVLLCHRNPAATSRYLVSVDGFEEEQKSSGVWIATAAGSTAAIGSAGGTVLPPQSRRIQFLVREPYLGVPGRAAFRLLRGFLDPRQRMVFASKMDEGKIFVDGPHISRPFGFGERLSVGLSDHPLRVYGMRVTGAARVREDVIGP
jgi:NAD+ kinase